MSLDTTESMRDAHAARQQRPPKRRRADAVPLGDDDDDDDDDNVLEDSGDDVDVDGAHDAVADNLVTALHKHLLQQPPDSTSGVATALQLAIGMPVTITSNSRANATEIGTVRNATGTVVAIVPDESSFVENRHGVRIYATHPLAVVVRLDGEHAAKLNIAGLPHGCVVLTPASVNFTIAARNVRDVAQRDSVTDPRCAVKVSRFGVALEVSWAFTAYKIQGQTLAHALFFADSSLSSYVPLSRVGSLAQLTVVHATPITPALLNDTPADAKKREALPRFMTSVERRHNATMAAWRAQRWPSAAADAAAAAAAADTADDDADALVLASTDAAPWASSSAVVATATQSTPALRPPNSGASSTRRSAASAFTSSSAPIPRAQQVKLANWQANSCCTDQLLPFIHVLFNTDEQVMSGVAAARDLTDDDLLAALEQPALLYTHTGRAVLEHERVANLHAGVVQSFASNAPVDSSEFGPYFDLREELHVLLARGNGRSAESCDVVPNVCVGIAQLASFGGGATPLLSTHYMTSESEQLRVDRIAADFRDAAAGEFGVAASARWLLLEVGGVFQRTRSAGGRLAKASDVRYRRYKTQVPSRLTSEQRGEFRLLLVLFYDGHGHFYSQIYISGLRAMQLRIAAGMYLCDTINMDGEMRLDGAWRVELADRFEQGCDAALAMPRLARYRNSLEKTDFPQFLLYERVTDE
jgi:hypothetical protein